jgi:hypothetical protein
MIFSIYKSNLLFGLGIVLDAIITIFLLFKKIWLNIEINDSLRFHLRIVDDYISVL